MTLDTVIIAFGAFVAVLPFLQLPQDWMAFFAFIAGIVIIGLGIVVRRRGKNLHFEQTRIIDADVEPSDGMSEQ